MREPEDVDADDDAAFGFAERFERRVDEQTVFECDAAAIVLGERLGVRQRCEGREADKTRADSLTERKDAIYANLRDLNFEYLAGKYPEQDYAEQRQLLEGEAAGVLAELDVLESHGVHRGR